MPVYVEGVKIRAGSIFPAWYAMEDRHQISRREAAERLGVSVDSLRSTLSGAHARGLPVDHRPPGVGQAARHAERRQALREDMEFVLDAYPGWSTTEVAERLGVSPRTIQRLRKT